MNDLYHWNAEMMVALEMEELKKEMDTMQNFPIRASFIA